MNEVQHIRGNFNNPNLQSQNEIFLKKCFKRKRRTLAFLYNPDKQKTTFNIYIWFGEKQPNDPI